MELNFEKIKQEYAVSIEDDDLVREIKEDFFNILSEGERRILILYMECETYAGVARYLGCSAPTARKAINNIIHKLK